MIEAKSLNLPEINSIYPYEHGILIMGRKDKHYILMNLNAKTNQVIFQAYIPTSISLINFTFHYIKRDTIYFTWRSTDKPITVYDDQGNNIPVHFDIRSNEANILAIDLLHPQFRLLKMSRNNPETYNINSGLYTYDYRSISVFGRRMSFLQKMIDYKGMLTKANIPFPSGYINPRNLKQLLELYHQQPGAELIQAGLKPDQTMVNQKQFEEIMLKLFYPS